jgi:putative MFS transporter
MGNRSSTNHDNAENKPTTVSQAIEDIGYGTFHQRLLLLGGLASGAGAMEATLLTLVQNCIASDWNLSGLEETFITVASFAGQIGGFLVGGMLADKFGRQKVLMIGWTIILIFGLINCLSVDIYMFIFTRFIVGIGVGSTQTVVYTLTTEFMPKTYRSDAVVLNVIGGISMLYVVGLSWGLLGSYGWRYVALGVALPMAVVIAMGYAVLLESPRWLASKKDYAEASRVVTAVSFVNNPEDPQTFTIKEDSSTGYELEEEDLFHYDKLLVTEPINLRQVTLTCWALWYFSFLVFYTLVLTVVDAFQDSSGCTNDYLYIFIIYAVGLSGFYISWVGMDTIGRCMTQGSFYIAMIFFTILYGIFDTNTASMVVLLSFLSISMQGGQGILWIQTAELFPTAVRGTGQSTCGISGRLGAITAIGIYDLYGVDNNVGNVSILAAACLLAAIPAFLLPETKGIQLDSAEMTHFDICDRLDEKSELLGSRPAVPPTKVEG